MHKLLLIGFLIFTNSTTLFAAKGTVKYTSGGCSWYLVETPSGLALLEWYGGNTPSKGDVIVGDYESYGMKKLYNLTKDSETSVWVDNFCYSRIEASKSFMRNVANIAHNARSHRSLTIRTSAPQKLPSHSFCHISYPTDPISLLPTLYRSHHLHCPV